MVASTTVNTSEIDRLKNTLTGLQSQLDELTRKSPQGVTPPVCRVKANVDLSIPANADVFIQTNWIVGEDPDNIAMLTPPAGAYSYMTVPVTGRYLVLSRAVFTSPAAASTMNVFITRNSTDSAASIARDVRDSTTNGADGTIVTAIRSVLLTEADKLFWGYWSYQACTLSRLVRNVPTEVSITYLGAR